MIRRTPSPRHRFEALLLTLSVLPALLLSAQPGWAHDDTQEEMELILHELEHEGAISELQHVIIDELYFEAGRIEDTHRWLEAEKGAGRLTAEAFGYLENLLDLTHGKRTFNLVPAEYTGNGNVTRLGHIDADPAGQIYNGVWGYAVGSREYALHTNSTGLHVIDVTDPTAPFRVQVIPMPGGDTWRDVDTYEDLPSGKTYAYVGAQSGGNLWVVDLSHLSGTAAHGVDSDPIPAAGAVDRGRTDWGHTVSITDGLLFMNSARTNGCQIFDLRRDPWDPPLVASWSGGFRDCHDSFARVDVPGSNGRNLLYSADGFASSFRVVDITEIRTGGEATVVGETPVVQGIYAHSNWLSEDSKYLFTFEEAGLFDVGIFDVSDPARPRRVRTFQYSGDAEADARVHNGQIRGHYLILGYYEAGLRVFDVSNPHNPAEVGKWETWRDPDGDGSFTRPTTRSFNGAWNVHVFLPSGTVLVSDTVSGLHLFRVDPVARPSAPSDLVATRGNGQVELEWTDASRETGYSVFRRTAGGGGFTEIASNVVGTGYTDTTARSDSRYTYMVNGVNAEGAGPRSSMVSVARFDGPDIVVGPERRNFGVVATGTSAPPRRVTVENAGTKPLELSAILIRGVNRGEFTLPAGEDACSGRTLRPGQSCRFLVGFEPTQTGLRRAMALVRSNDPVESDVRVQLRGTGTP